MATPTITIEIDLDYDSATFEKYVLTDTTNWVAEGYILANITGFFVITDPLGAYYTGSFGSPDTDGSSSMVFDTLGIRQNSELGILLGTYTVEYFAKDSVSGDEFSTSSTFEVDPPLEVIDADGVVQQGIVTHTINPFTLILSITDNTDHGDYASRTRVMYLDPPQFTGLPQVTGSGPTLTYNFSWVNTAYSLWVDTLLAYTEGDYTLTVRMKYLEAIVVQVPQNMATLYQCFIRFTEYFNAQASIYGGIANIKGNLRDDYFYTVALFVELEAAVKISDFTTSESVFTLVESTMNKYVACDCGCGDTTKPVLANPYAGGAESYTFAATYPVIVAVVGSTVTYSLAPAFVAAVSAIAASVVNSTDGSVTVSSLTSGGVTTYTLSVKQSFAFNALLTYSSGSNISVTISNANRQGTRYVDPSAGWTAGNNLQVVGYPFGSAAALNAAEAVFYIEDFLTTAGTTPPDKLDLSEIMILNVGESETDFTQQAKVRLEIHGKGTDKIYFRLVDALDGQPISMDRFIAEHNNLTITCKINQ